MTQSVARAVVDGIVENQYRPVARVRGRIREDQWPNTTVVADGLASASLDCARLTGEDELIVEQHLKGATLCLPDVMPLLSVHPYRASTGVTAKSCNERGSKNERCKAHGSEIL